MRKKTEELLLKRSRPLYKKKDLKILVNSKPLINASNKSNIFKNISKFHTQECNNKSNIPQAIITNKEKEFEKEAVNNYNSSNKIRVNFINNENFDNSFSKRYKKINSQKIVRKYSLDNYGIDDMIITDKIEFNNNKDVEPMNYSKSKNIKISDYDNPYSLKRNKNVLNSFKVNILQKNKEKDYSSSNNKNLLNKNYDAQYQDYGSHEEEKHIINIEKNKNRNKYNICINNPNFSPKFYFDYKKTSNLLSNNYIIENNKFNLFRKKKICLSNNLNNNNINAHFISCKNMSSKNAFDLQNYFSIKNNKKLINNEENNDDIPIKNKIHSFNINIPNKNNSNNFENLYYNPTISNENSYFNDKSISNREHKFKTENKNYFYSNEQYSKSSSSNTFNCSHRVNNNSNINLKEKYNKISIETNLKRNKYASATDIFNNKEKKEFSEFKKNKFEKNNLNIINNINENKLQKIVKKSKTSQVNRKKIKRIHTSFNKINFNYLEKPKLCKTLSSIDLNDDIINYKKYNLNENLFNMKNDYCNNAKFLKQSIEKKNQLISNYHPNDLLEKNEKINNKKKKGKAFCFNNNSKTDRLNHYNGNIINIRRNSVRNKEENKNVLNDEYDIDNIINKYKNNSFLYTRQKKNQKLKNLLFIYERLFKRKNPFLKSQIYDNTEENFMNGDKDDINYKKNKNQKTKIKYLTPNSTKNKDNDSNFIIDKANVNNKMHTLNYENTKRTNDSNRRKIVSCLENNEFIFNINHSRTLLSNIKCDNNSYNYTYRKMNSLIKNKNSESQINIDEKRKSKRLLYTNSENTIDGNHFYDDFNNQNIEKDLNINENYFEQIKKEAKERYSKSNIEESDIGNKENYNANNLYEESNKELMNNIKGPIIINNKSYLYDNYGDDNKIISNIKSRVKYTRNNHISDNKTINNCSFRYKNIIRNSNITENENNKEEERKFSSVDNEEDFNIENNPDNLLLITKCPKCHFRFGQPTDL